MPLTLVSYLDGVQVTARLAVLRGSFIVSRRGEGLSNAPNGFGVITFNTLWRGRDVLHDNFPKTCIPCVPAGAYYIALGRLLD